MSVGIDGNLRERLPTGKDTLPAGAFARVECLDENAVLELLEGLVDATRSAEITVHLDRCAACRTLVADATREASAVEGGDAADPVPPLAVGTVLGRYVILETLGAGAMGIVYGAYDPDLGRKVALKVLRGATDEETRARLLREAQALARLSHPNVVAIHDLGTDRGRVFLAMELIEGDTLAAWLRGRPRPQAVIDALVSAGRGLAAAHAAGLVHRDFKPANVLVGEDGRARVTDFGLAHGDEGPAAGHGAAGTPAYMAPEQRVGGPTDARSDQYAFCATLHEALSGQRPPAGADALPRWTRPILGKARSRRHSRRSLPGHGHSPVPPGRRGPSLTPRRSLGGAAIVLAAGAAIAFAMRPARAQCDGAEAAWGNLWGQGDRAEVAAAFARSDRPGRDTALARVTETLDAYRARWVNAHTETCRATRVRGDQSEALLDLRMQCLAGRRRQAEAPRPRPRER